MKRIYLLLVLLVANATAGVMAQTRVRIGEFDYHLSGEEASVYESLFYDGPKIIPAEVEYQGMTFTVTSIESYALENTTSPTIVLPNTIRSIEEFAFKNCEYLTTMIIPASVVSMDHCFYGDALLRTLIYLPSKAPSRWTATTNTYVPSFAEYSLPAFEMNNAKVIEMLTFNDKVTTYGEAVDIHDHKVNIADCGYELAGLTAKHGLHTDAGTWCDTLHAQFTNAEADVPVLDVDIPFHHTVAKAKLTAKVVSTSRQYGEENPPFKVVYTGFVNNENESVLDEPVTVSVNADKNSPAGTYAISLSGGKAKNYDIAYEPGVLTVTKALLTARVKNAERTYGEPNPDFQIEYTDLKTARPPRCGPRNRPSTRQPRSRATWATTPSQRRAACPAIMNSQASRPAA